MERVYIEPKRSEWNQILQRPAFDSSSLEATVGNILNDVKQNGDVAVKKYAAQFDGVELNELKVTEAEIAEAVLLVDEKLKQAIQQAKKNIEAFHTIQKETIQKVETTPGVVCWRKSIAIQKVGLYIPGGSAPLFSTLLMLGIPAVLAGSKEIVVCTPSGKDGKVNPVILYTAQLIGLKNIYKIGGVQAIGAMAYGTATVPQVYKIFGPGNQYVTCAKQLVNKAGIAIDMPAGPSEVAVYADETSNAAFIAADLLSQAEHGADSQVVLVASSEFLVKAVQAEVEKQLKELPRKDIAIKALQHSRYIVVKNVDDAFELLNEYAAEHLIIASDNALALAEKVTNAGSVFIGHYSPESVGDYASGTNHTLPTNGYAKAYSGVSLDSFFKKVTFQQLTKEGINNIGNTVEIMAAAEGLDAHKNAVTVRLDSLKNIE
ncbi:histidinol dehydrogenase [Ferruginibacter lapsinanis]|uniref:histidinol dehydrogenase n=1 Tax=Ferruginibacter lapsinanis TaxID=563172 RepID=UPI001E3181DD|nr:histidinol dehydrogenase [Ferruginibacter lapsinanis]UEG49779.1 histidinol dehydrogenase [Ferruginibacter lapsinanis]